MTPPRANTYIPLKINGWKFWQLLCIPKCMLDTLETTFQGKKTFCLVKGSLSWSETPYFHNCAKVASEHQNVRKKLFFSSSFISGSKWLRKWVLNWRFLRELKYKPIFEQVTPSRSSGKKENALGQICPPGSWKVQNIPGQIESKGFEWKGFEWKFETYHPKVIN